MRYQWYVFLEVIFFVALSTRCKMIKRIEKPLESPENRLETIETELSFVFKEKAFLELNETSENCKNGIAKLRKLIESKYSFTFKLAWNFTTIRNNKVSMVEIILFYHVYR